MSVCYETLNTCVYAYTYKLLYYAYQILNERDRGFNNINNIKFSIGFYKVVTR